MSKKEEINKKALTWAQLITQQGKIDRAIDDTLSPSKGQLRYIVDYAKIIETRATRIEWTSILAHGGEMEFDRAQEIIDYQKSEMDRDIEYLKGYLEDINE